MQPTQPIAAPPDTPADALDRKLAKIERLRAENLADYRGSFVQMLADARAERET